MHDDSNYYIDIGRKFTLRPFNNSASSSSDYSNLSFSLSLEDPQAVGDSRFGWDKLLQQRIVIILSGAGEGKTTECKERVKILKRGNQYAWYIKVEDIADKKLTQILRVEDNTQFLKWRNDKTGDKAYFFLDSVDEARLKRKEFRQALTNLEKAIGNENKKYAHIFITCRVSDWLKQEDLQLVKDCFCSQDEKKIIPTSDENQDIQKTVFVSRKPLLVFLEPLTIEQAKKFAQSLSVNVDNMDLLFNKIEEKNLTFWTKRPMDIKPLLTLWDRKGAIDSHEEMFKENIQQRLEETTLPRRQEVELDIDTLKNKAKKLATALTFCQKDNVLLPGNSPSPKIGQVAISADELFTDWIPKRINEFLTRGLFVPAGAEDQVSFHHRSVKEYLVACWLQEQTEKGGNLENIAEHIFYQGYNKKNIFSPMEPIIAWLAVWNKKLRKEILKISPNILFQKSDLYQFSKKDRVKLFQKILKIASEDRRFIYSLDAHPFKNLAHTDIEKSIKHKLSFYKWAPISQNKKESAIQFILRLIHEGKLDGCADKAFSFALEDKFSDSTIIDAIKAVALTQSTNKKRKLVEHFIKKKQPSNPDVFITLLEAFFPKELSVNQLVALLKYLEKENHSIYSADIYLHEILYTNCPENQHLCLLSGLTDILSNPPLAEDSNELYSLSQKYGWVASPFLKLINKILEENSSWDINSDEMISALAKAILKIDRAVRYDSALIYEDKFKDKINQYPKLKRALYWQAIEWGRKKGKDIWFSIYTYNRIAVPNIQDTEWLIEDIQGKENAQDKNDALESVFWLWVYNDEDQDLDIKIHNAISDSHELQKKYADLCQKNQERKKAENKEQFWQKELNKREKIRIENIKKSRRELEEVFPQLRSGEAENALIWLGRRIKNISQYSFTKTEWDSLIPDFGEEIVDAAKSGVKKYWKFPHIIQKLKKENYGGNSTPWEAILSLAGLALVSQNDDWANELSQEEAEHAAKIALFELNGFPLWLDKLYEKHKNIVLDVFSSCLRKEAQREGDRLQLAHDIAYHASENIREDLAPYCVEILEGGGFSQHYEYALNIILKSKNIDHERFYQLSQQRFQKTKDTIWLAVMFHIDGCPALKELKAYIEKKPDRVEWFMESLIILLSPNKSFGNDRIFVQSKHKDYLCHLNVVFELTRLAYKYIRLADDAEHREGSSWTLNSRDFAQNGRDSLLNKLAQFEGKETSGMLKTLAKEPHIKCNKYLKSYIEKLDEDRSQGDNKFRALTIEEFKGLEEKIAQKTRWKKIYTWLKKHWDKLLITILVSLLAFMFDKLLAFMFNN